MKKGNVIFLCTILVMLTASLTFFVTMHVAVPHIWDKFAVASKVAEIESRLQNYFIEDYDESLLGDAAAEAVIEATGDPWSYYIPASEYSAFKDNLDNAYTGIGIAIVKEPTENGFTVSTVQEEGPAYAAGIRAGDVLTFVEEDRALELGFNAMRERVGGEEGTWVTLTLERDGMSYTTKVQRKRIDTIAVRGTVLESGVGYVRILNFDRNAAQQTIDILEDFKAKNVPGVIFDVRVNRGGHRAELVKLLDYLLPEGIVFKSIDHDGKETNDHSDANFFDLPMVVLVDKYSYSAAEFFAAALQEYEKASVVGEPTTGKGNYQVSMPLSDGSAINISIGKYFTPKGKSLTDVGVTPDVVVTNAENEKIEETYTRQLETGEKLILSSFSPNNNP